MGFEERKHQPIQGSTDLSKGAVPSRDTGLAREVARFSRALESSPMQALNALLKSPHRVEVVKELTGDCLKAMNSAWQKATHSQRYTIELLAREIARDQTKIIDHRKCALGFITHQKEDPVITNFAVNQIKKLGFWDSHSFGLGWGTEERAIDLLRAVSGDSFTSILKTTVRQTEKNSQVWNFYRFRELNLLGQGYERELHSVAGLLQKELKGDAFNTNTKYIREHLNTAQDTDPGFTRRFAKTLQAIEQTRALGALYERAINSGITRPYRFSEKILNELLDNSTQVIPDNKPYALVALNKSDEFGAFSDERATIKQLIDAGYFVRVVEASNESEFMNHLRTNCSGRKADLMVIGGHGSKTSLSLGGADPRTSLRKEDERLSLDLHDTDVLKRIGESTAPRGQVFLLSCNTAEGGAKANNFAQAVEKACLPSVSVFAAKISVSKCTFNFSTVSTQHGMWPKIKQINFPEPGALLISPGR